ncbi:hypothetical protein F5Y17DRAFT_368114 [Xylariaceae sp. FL0594]|nr:hypothetical protein F5Y17DRAFT_368114 [Xylariaceae sp. FL0594]
MSDISVDSEYEEPWTLKSAGENKGYGLFATRDVKVGEVVLTDWTSLLFTSELSDQCLTSMIQQYAELNESDKETWRKLTMYGTPDMVEKMNRHLDAHVGPDSRKLDDKEKALYLELWLAFENNSFTVEPGVAGMFALAAKFNHSCEPNVEYECRLMPGRWVGRARRNVKRGEEFTISYVPTDAPKHVRNEATRHWGFECDCVRCAGGPDEYTAELAEACDLANGVEPDRDAERPKHGEGAELRLQQLTRRADLLRELAQKPGKEGMVDKSRTKELFYALYDLAHFHLHAYIRREKGEPSAEARAELEKGRVVVGEALDAARTAWAPGHEMVKLCKRELAYIRLNDLAFFPPDRSSPGDSSPSSKPN